MIKYIRNVILNMFNKHISNGDTCIKWVPLNNGGREPKKSHKGDAGWDLYTSSDVYIEPYGTSDIPTGISAVMPSDIWLYIVGRSSTLRTRGIMVIPAIIDSDYTGELYIYVYNITGNTIVINKGERIAQVIPYRHVSVVWERGTNIPVTSRGSNGFGSTGK